MKKRLKSWITTIFGLVLMVISGLFFFIGKIEILPFVTCVVLGFGLFMDNKIHEYIKALFK